MARTVARTFKDFILVAAAVFVVKPRHALMASRRTRYACHGPRPPLQRATRVLAGHALPILYRHPRVGSSAC